MIIRVAVDFGEPDHLFGIHGLAVNYGGDFSVAPAGVKANAAALHVAAHGLGRVLGLWELVRQDHLKGVLEHTGHIVPVKGLLAACAVCGGEVVVCVLIAADVNFKAAFHPEDGLYQPVDVVVVSLAHFLRSVDKGAADGHLAVGALHRDAYRLFRILQKCLIEFIQRDEAGVQFGYVLYIQFYAEIFHNFLLDCV